MARFREALNDCNLTDIGFHDTWYTWERGQFSENNIRERLDRGVANQAWWHSFPKYSLKHLHHAIPNHCPLLVDLGINFGNKPIQRKFKFNPSWVLEEECEKHVKYFWG